MPKIGIGITLIGIVIIIASFALPSFSIIYINSASINSPNISYLSYIPSSQSITNPSISTSSTSNILNGQFIIHDANATGTYSSTITWYIGSVVGSSQQFNTSVIQQYNVNFNNYNATLNVSVPYTYQKNVEFFVHLNLVVNNLFVNGETLHYTTPNYYGEFINTSSYHFDLVVMYKNSNNEYITHEIYMYNGSNTPSLLKIPYQTTIKAEYLIPSFVSLSSNITTWLKVNGKYYSISYNVFNNYPLKPGNNTLVFGYNLSGVPGVNGNVSITEIVQYIYVSPHNFNITTLIIGIGVTIIGVIILVVRRI